MAARKIKETDYAFAVAYTRTLQNRMLERADFDTLLAVSSTSEALRYLMDRGYGSKNYDRLPSPEVLLKDELAYVMNEVSNACPDGAPISLVLYRNDFANLKTILKALFSGLDYRSLAIEPYTVPPDELHTAIAESRFDDLPMFISEPALEAYRILARNEDGQQAEIALDKAFYKTIKEVALATKDLALIDWVDLSIAIMDMKIALRGAYSGKNSEFLREAMLECTRFDIDALAEAIEAGVPSVLDHFSENGYPAAAIAAEESISGFEKWCDNELMNNLRSARYDAFGFKPILGFLVGKQFELQTVRIIFSGLQGSIPSTELSDRMRDIYV